MSKKENLNENGSIRIRRRLKNAGTLGTFINAMGLAAGILLIDRYPVLAVWVIVGSVVAYALFRLLVGHYESELLNEEARNHRDLPQDESHAAFPATVRYRAELNNVNADLTFVREK